MPTVLLQSSSFGGALGCSPPQTARAAGVTRSHEARKCPCHYLNTFLTHVLKNTFSSTPNTCSLSRHCSRNLSFLRWGHMLEEEQLLQQCHRVTAARVLSGCTMEISCLDSAVFSLRLHRYRYIQSLIITPGHIYLYWQLEVGTSSAEKHPFRWNILFLFNDLSLRSHGVHRLDLASFGSRKQGSAQGRLSNAVPISYERGCVPLCSSLSEELEDVLSSPFRIKAVVS